MTVEPAPVVRRLPSLTGLRFAAAFGVFGYHFAPHLTGDAHTVLGEVFDRANSGVSFFFILSGVVLTWSRGPGDTPRRFYQRRFARIYPDYLAAWVLTLFGLAYQGRMFDFRGRWTQPAPGPGVGAEVEHLPGLERRRLDAFMRGVLLPRLSVHRRKG